MTTLTFAEAMNVYRASRAMYEATDWDSLDVVRENEISNAHWATADVVLQAPVLTGDELLEKLSMIDERYMVDSEAIPDVDWEALKRDIISLIRPADADEQSRKTENQPVPAAPDAIATPAQAHIYHPDPVSEFLAIENQLNAGGSSEGEYLASIDRLYEWRPDTAEGFTRKFAALMGNPEDDGWPPRDRMLILVQDAHRLGERVRA